MSAAIATAAALATCDCYVLRSAKVRTNVTASATVTATKADYEGKCRKADMESTGKHRQSTGKQTTTEDKKRAGKQKGKTLESKAVRSAGKQKESAGKHEKGKRLKT